MKDHGDKSYWYKPIMNFNRSPRFIPKKALNLPIITLICSSIFFVLLWHALNQYNHMQLRKQLYSNVKLIGAEISTDMGWQFHALKRFFHRASGKTLTPKDWHHDAESYIKDIPSIVLISKVFNDDGNQRLFQYNPNFNRSKAIQVLNECDHNVATPSDIKNASLAFKQSSFLKGYAICYKDIISEQDVILDVKLMFEKIILPHLEEGLELSVSEGDQDIYQVGDTVRRKHNWKWEVQFPIHYEGHNFKVRLWPTRRYVLQNVSWFPEAVLVFGLIITFLLSYLLFLWRVVRNSNVRLEMEVERRTNDLVESQHRYHMLYENSPDMYFSVSAVTRNIIQCNQTLVMGLSYISKEEIVGKDMLALYHPNSHKKLLEAYGEFQETGQIKNTELEFIRKDGVKVYVILKMNAMRDEAGKIISGIVSCRDLSEQKALEHERNARLHSEKLFGENKKLFEKILDAATDGWWDRNLETNDEYLSPKFKALFGYDDHELPNVTESWQKIIYKDDLKQMLANYKKHIDSEGEYPFYQEVRYHHKNGGTVWVLCRGQAIQDPDGELRRMIGTHTDLTKLKITEEKLESMAHYDRITKLPNRNFFQDILNRTFERSKRSKKSFAILYFDLDNFKTINDSFGHDIGDMLLVNAAERIQSVMRKDHFVARIGGDEFVILTDELQSIEQAGILAKRVVDVFADKISILNRELYVTASVGIAVYPFAGETPEELLRSADVAMYQAKEKGRNNYQYYTSKLHKTHQRILHIDQELQHAIKRQELMVYYQPIYDIDTLNLVGFEALVRWKNDRLGSILPEEFIPIAEENGVIFELGEWVFSQACEQVAKWHAHKLLPDNFQISINCSVLQLEQGGFLDFVDRMVSHYGIQYNNIILEVTESTLMQRIAHTSQMLSQFTNKGIEVAIDDFGTGYSSLNYLKSLPISLVKIDSSFTSDLMNHEDARTIVEAIVKLATTLKLDVIAEGVETKGQLDLLASLGCKYAQGFYLAEPLQPTQIEALLGKGESIS